MADTLTGSTVPRRQLGRYLRELRTEAGLTIKDAARGLEWSETKIWRIESGQTSLRSFDVEVMCRVYGAKADITQVLMGLASQTKARGWWQAYGDAVPGWFDMYVGLEGAANRLSLYGQEVVPGLFQTERYAAVVITANHPDETAEETGKRVSLRIARQAVIRREIDRPELQVALSESVLRRPVGGPAVMAEQLRHLAQASGLPNVALRVVPFSAGYYPGIVTGSFNVLRFPPGHGGQESEPPTVYKDTYTGALYLDKEQEVAKYSEAFAGIWSQALDEPASRELIQQAAEELEHEH